MMRLPHFRYHAPRSIDEAARVLADAGPDAMLLAGGTDLLPNMKRRHQVPATLVGLRRVDALREIRNGTGMTIGSGVALGEIVRDARIREGYRGLWQAAAQVATPHLRNMATLGGNVCLDTRCNYYNQNYEWRKAIDFCMKKDGEVCWVATSSPKCLAVSSTDTAPALIALGARVRLASASGERVLALSELYDNDGIRYLTKRSDELVIGILLGPSDGWRSAYWKLRRRGSFDFPVLGVAAAARFTDDGIVREARVVLGAVSSRPMESVPAAEALVGKPLTDSTIEHAAELAFQVAKPMDNTDFVLHWRKRVSREFTSCALRELRGDDMRAIRLRIARQPL
jgi:4-hydroxybenzoyl-CoA reductase subunit beta